MVLSQARRDHPDRRATGNRAPVTLGELRGLGPRCGFWAVPGVNPPVTSERSAAGQAVGAGGPFLSCGTRGPRAGAGSPPRTHTTPSHKPPPLMLGPGPRPGVPAGRGWGSRTSHEGHGPVHEEVEGLRYVGDGVGQRGLRRGRRRAARGLGIHILVPLVRHGGGALRTRPPLSRSSPRRSCGLARPLRGRP